MKKPEDHSTASSEVRRCNWHYGGEPAAYGGMVCAELLAAAQTLQPTHRTLHSFCSWKARTFGDIWAQPWPVKEERVVGELTRGQVSWGGQLGVCGGARCSQSSLGM